MSYVYGYGKNKYVIFGIVLAIYLLAMTGSFSSMSIISIIVVVTGTALLMMIIRETIHWLRSKGL
jgi:hypothetical protein